MADLVTEIMDKSRMLDVAISELKRRGQKYAEAERDYRVALAKQTLIERDNGVPVTIISDICKGNPEIARFRFERDCAEVLYRSALEAINSMKLQIKLMNAQLDREWCAAK